MNCKKCAREIPAGSAYCNWCGAKQVKQKKQEITVPAPRLLPSGMWFIQLRVNGKSTPITEADKDVCIAKAMSIKAGLDERKKDPPAKTVGQAVDEYIALRSNLLSPSTLKSYKNIRKFRFASLMEKDVHRLTKADVQAAINDETPKVKPKTLTNSWGLIKSAIADYVSFDTSKILLPMQQPRDVTVYGFDELVKLFTAVKGDEIEMAVLLAACLGLRRSEILGLSPGSFDKEAGTVTINCARVPDENNNLVEKGTKTKKSTRVLTCPKYILDMVGDGENYLYTGHKQNYIASRLTSICRAHGLPHITLHELRHTNASTMLALNIPDKYAQERGGWSSNSTMKKIYQHTMDDHRKNADTLVNSYFEQVIESVTANKNANE